MLIWKQAKYSLTRHKRARQLPLAVLALFILINTYVSIFRVGGHRTRLFNKILRRTSVDDSHYLQVQFKALPNRLPLDATLREQLHYQYPYNVDTSIPKLIWQTWKYSRNDPDFKGSFFKFSQEWIDMHPDYSYTLVPDSDAAVLIRHLYGSIPSVLEAYQSLPKPILKADFFRYLILFARGGIYSDVDTIPLKPAPSWVSGNTTIYDDANDAGLVIGIEADPDRPDWNQYYAKRVQFCQWTIQSKPGHPMLGELIARITEITLQKKKGGELKKVSGKDSGDDIMHWTGPGIFTDEILKYFNELVQLKPMLTLINKTPANDYNEGLNIKKDGVDWRSFTLMEEPIVFDDVLVLPITSFSPGVGHMGSKSIQHANAYVRHMFEGSWKPENERMKQKKQKKPKHDDDNDDKKE